MTGDVTRPLYTPRISLSLLPYDAYAVISYISLRSQTWRSGILIFVGNCCRFGDVTLGGSWVMSGERGTWRYTLSSFVPIGPVKAQIRRTFVICRRERYDLSLQSPDNPK